MSNLKTFFKFLWSNKVKSLVWLVIGTLLGFVMSYEPAGMRQTPQGFVFMFVLGMALSVVFMSYMHSKGKTPQVLGFIHQLFDWILFNKYFFVIGVVAYMVGKLAGVYFWTWWVAQKAM